MARYLIIRIVQSLLLIFGVTFMIFFVINIATDNFYEVGSLDINLNPYDIARYRATSGISETVALRYIDWISDILHGNMGMSNKRPEATVISIIVYHLPKSILLVITSLFLSILISIPIGIILAVYSGRWIIRWLEIVILMGIGVPSFVPAIVGIYLFSILVNWLPFNGVYVGQSYVWYKQMWIEARFLILPMLGLAFGITCTLVGFIRTSLLEIFQEDFIRTARAKGLGKFKVIFKHALKNAVIPWLTTLGMAVPILFSELFIVEKIFSWPGITTQMLDGLARYDYPLILGIAICLCVILVWVNLLIDILYGLVNPQIRYAWGDRG